MHNDNTIASNADCKKNSSGDTENKQNPRRRVLVQCIEIKGITKLDNVPCGSNPTSWAKLEKDK
jgi:hypothetical protein